MLPKCVKCGEIHKSIECTVDFSEKTNNLKCANCGGNHTPNYQGCPKYKRQHELIKNRTQKQTLNPHNTQKPTHPDSNYYKNNKRKLNNIITTPILITNETSHDL